MVRRVGEAQMVSELGEAGEAQVGDGYKCQCGFIADTLKKFRSHFMRAGRKDGKGVHKSVGRVNLQTGEITMPPYLERTPEQIAQSKHGKKKEKGDKSDVGLMRGTDILANASQIKFIPRIYTVDYTPIMRGAQEAAIRVWKWRDDMPLGNFLDTILYIFFKEHGIILAAYIVEEEKEEAHGQINDGG